MTARSGCAPDAAPNPDTYPVNFSTLPACGAVYCDTSLLSTDAESTDDPGCVVPNVDVPPAAKTVIVTGALTVEAPCESVTRSRTVYVPGLVYVKLGPTTVESPYTPSPFRSHENEIVSPGSGSDEPEPLKLTVNGAVPLVGLAVATADGGLFPAV